MTERTIELDAPLLSDDTANALREATGRAERAEAEVARLKSTAAHTPASAGPPGPERSAAAESNLFEPLPDALPAAAAHERRHADDDAGSSAATEHAARASAPSDDAVHTDTLKQPPTPSTAANAPGYDSAAAVTERGSADRAGADDDGAGELRKDPMMAHLLDSLDAGTDVGHYGRLVFSMVARHFLPHPQVVAWLTKDNDFSTEQAQQMLHQVEGRDYTPPRRERLLQWQREQDFKFMDVHDPDSGNLYRNLEFPKEVYDHIGHYQDAKAAE